MQAGLDEVWPYAFELFEVDDLRSGWSSAGVAADPAALQPVWRATVEDALAEATLTCRDRLAADRRPARDAHRGLRLPARRAAAPAPLAPGGVSW
jgi:ring-1,2-phenylacetyl-CoA epoxidase subunit PaaC